MADTLHTPRVHYITTMAAAKLFFHMREHDESLTATVDGKQTFWTLTKAGTPVDRRIVSQLILDGSLIPFGQMLLDDAPSCLMIDPNIGDVHLGSPQTAEKDDEAEDEAAEGVVNKEDAVHLGPSPTACGAFSRDDCDKRAWCADCAPPEIAKKAAKGNCKNWIGPPAEGKGAKS